MKAKTKREFWGQQEGSNFSHTGDPHKIFLIRNFEGQRVVDNVFKVLKEKVNWEYYIQQYFPSKVREKLRLSQVNKSWESHYHWTFHERNTTESPISWNKLKKKKRTLVGYSKFYEDIKISLKINTWVIIKASIIVTILCNTTFCFLQDLRR